MADDKLLQTAKNNLDKLGDALGKQVGTAVTSSTNSTVDASSKLAAVKSSFATPVGTLKKIPEEVYKKIAEALNSAIPESIFTKYSTNEGKLIKQVATQIGKVLSSIDDQKVTVKENGKNVTYTIKFEGSHLGVKGSFINVSNGKNDSWLNWKNETSGKTAMAEYCAALYQLGKDVTNKFWKSVVSIFAKNAVSLFKEIYSVGGTDNGLKKILGNSLFKQISKDEIKFHVNSILSSSSNKKIATALTQYESLNTAYRNLETEINSTKSTVKTIQSKSTAFTTASKKVQNSLKSLGVIVSLETLPAPSIGLTYDKNNTAVTVPSGYTSELKTSDYKSSVKTIYAGDFTKAVTINGNAKDNTIYCGTGNDKLYGLGGKDVLYGYGGKDTLYGGAGNDTLYGGANNDSLFGEADSDKLYGEEGDDTLVGGKGSDTLTGGAGKDVFYYSSGDGADTITDYTAGDDKIKIASGKIDKVTMSGTTVTFKIGSGSIKVQNVKDKEIIVVDASNRTSKYRNGKLVSGGEDESDTITGGGVTVTLSVDTTGTFDLTTYNKTATKKATSVDARASKNGLTLYGDDRANTIWAPNNVKSSYWSGSIYAGKGNDNIYCGSGCDDICYYKGDGNETVYNFKTGDDIYLYNGVKFKNVTLSGKDVVLNLDSGNTITLKDAKDEKVYVSSYDANGDWVGSKTFGKGSISGNTISLLDGYEGLFRLSDYSANPLNVDARASKNGLTLYGDDKANTIWAPNNVKSSYWSGSIYAGKGNDNIYCGSGCDDICYYKGDGNETVYNFKTGDDIYLYNGVKFKNVTLSGKDVVLNLDSGNTITLKDAKDEKIYISGSDTNGNFVGTLAFSSSSSNNLAYSADMAEEHWFMSTTESNAVGDLDSLMREIPTTDRSVVSFSADSVNDPNKLLNSITFAQVTKKK